MPPCVVLPEFSRGEMAWNLCFTLVVLINKAVTSQKSATRRSSTRNRAQSAAKKLREESNIGAQHGYGDGYASGFVPLGGHPPPIFRILS